MRGRRVVLTGAAMLLALQGVAPAQEAPEALTDAAQIMERAHLNMYYAGDDGRVTVEMTLEDKKGNARSRKFIMLRLDEKEGGRQKYYTYFLEPSDIKGTTFMVWKEPVEDDARWIFVPAVDLVRRISAKDKGSSFVGSDFSYEDVSGRHWTDDEHLLTGTETRGDKECYVIESVPKGKDAFSRKVSWISKTEILPVREEYYDRKGGLERVFESLTIEDAGGYLTVTRRKMTNTQKEHSTTVVFSDIEYDIGLQEDVFTERYLKSPPAQVHAE